MEQQRHRMVEKDLKGRDITDPGVITVMGRLPREEFMPESYKSQAYADGPLPIGMGQTISQPYIVAYMTEQLSVGAGSVVLEIGTGSGYQAAILSCLALEVHTIETIEDLHLRAKRLLESLGCSNVVCYLGDGYRGVGEPKAFDRIIVTAAAPRIPEPLVALLRPAGKMILPVGSPYGYQELVLVEHDGEVIHTRSLIGVRFVPMTGNVRRKKR